MSALVARELPVLDPPAIKTFPFGKRVAECPPRLTVIAPVDAKLPVARSYTSAEARAQPAGMKCKQENPPAIKTFPLGRRLAVCPLYRVVLIPPVALNAPAAGSDNSAFAERVIPPAINTFPLFKRVAVCQYRVVPMAPVAVKLNTPVPLKKIGSS